MHIYTCVCVYLYIENERLIPMMQALDVVVCPCDEYVYTCMYLCVNRKRDIDHNDAGPCRGCGGRRQCLARISAQGTRCLSGACVCERVFVLFVFACVCVCVFVCVCGCLCLCVYMYIMCTPVIYKCKNIIVYVYMFMYTYIHVYIYIYINTELAYEVGSKS